jgi:hypothetical protein
MFRKVFKWLGLVLYSLTEFGVAEEGIWVYGIVWLYRSCHGFMVFGIE